jgi:hypothetical protein
MMGEQNQGSEGRGGNQSDEGSEAEKVKTLADRAGGGSNKGSGLGSNEQLDQAGDQDNGGPGE